MILFNIHLATRGYVSDLGLDILGNYYLHGKILFTSVLATRGHVSGLGLDIYIYISMYRGKLLFTWEIIIYHCLGLDTYTHPSTRGNDYLHGK
jgi:hypothetical protein